MSETNPQPLVQSPAQGIFWPPLVLRAVVALIFGAVTIFWLNPSDAVFTSAAGAYLLLTGASFVYQARAGSPAPARVGLVVGALAAVAGIVVMALPAFIDVAALVLALGLAVLGAAEIGWFIQGRGTSPLARDWIVSGVVGVAAAILLPFFIELGAHALLGVSGGAAVIIGVLWMLSGLTFRHDARAARNTA